MEHKALLAIIAAICIYHLVPRSERVLLVLANVQEGFTPRLTDFKTIDNIREVLKIERNLDAHVDETADHSEKEKWKYVLITEDMQTEKESLKFGNHIKTITFIKEFKVIEYESNHLRVAIINLLIKLLGFVSPLTGSTLTPLKPGQFPSESTSDMFEDLCSEKSLATTHPNVIVNILKEKDTDAMWVYEKACLFTFFPLINNRIVEAGKAKSDYWTRCALVEYQNRAGLCRMVGSKEWNQKEEFKKRGLGDSETYLTSRLV